MEGTSYVFSFRMVFFYLVTTGWIFDISLYEKSINQSRDQILRRERGQGNIIFTFPAQLTTSKIGNLVADGPQLYHPGCGHYGSSHLSPVRALRFFIAMQVQHSYSSSSNG